MKHSLIIFTVLLCLGLAGTDSARAQNTLTLEEAIGIALEQNPDLLIARHSRQQASHNLTAARANALPSVAVGGGYRRTWDQPDFVIRMPGAIPGTEQEIRVPGGSDHSMSGQVSLEQPLFAGGAIWAGIGIAKDAQTIAEYSLAATTQRTIENVYSAFYAVLLSQSLLAVSETAVHNASVNLDQVDNRYRYGAASRFELLRAQVQLATVRPGLTEARNRQRLALERIKDLLNLDKHEPLQVSGSFEPRAQNLLDRPLQDMIDLAYEHRPEYRIQQLQKDISEKRLRLVRSEFMPQLALTSAVQWQAQRNDLHFNHDDFERTTYAGLVLRIPLFEGFGSKARYSESRLELRKSEVQTDNLKNLIATEVQAVRNELAEAHEILMSQKQVMEQAQEGLRLANLLYEEGAATLLEVIDAQLALNQASTSYYRSIYNYNTAAIKLERACGILKMETLFNTASTEAP